jgi:hypothetical protein
METFSDQDFAAALDDASGRIGIPPSISQVLNPAKPPDLQLPPVTSPGTQDLNAVINAARARGGMMMPSISQVLEGGERSGVLPRAETSAGAHELVAGPDAVQTPGGAMSNSWVLHRAEQPDVLLPTDISTGAQDFRASRYRSDTGIQTDVSNTTDRDTQTSPIDAEDPASQAEPTRSGGQTPTAHMADDNDDPTWGMPGSFVEESPTDRLSSPASGAGGLPAEDDAGQDLGSAVSKYAVNLTEENFAGLMAALREKGVDSPADLEGLSAEYGLRGTLRALVFGGMSAAGFSADTMVTDAISGFAPESVFNGVPLGLMVAAPTSTLVHTVLKGAGPKHSMSVAAMPYSKLTGAESELHGQNVVNNQPYSSLDYASSFAIGATAVSGLTGWRATAIKVGAGIAGFMARGNKTFRNNEAIRTSGGKNPVQPWLDADDLEKTKSTIDDLRQPWPVALSGYAADIGSAVRDRLGPALAAVGKSPRVYAYGLALAPSAILGIVGRSAAAQDMGAQVGYAVLANLAHTAGLVNRLNIEHIMTTGVESVAGKLGYNEFSWTHKGALANAGLDQSPTAIVDPEQGLGTTSGDTSSTVRGVSTSPSLTSAELISPRRSASPEEESPSPR